MAYPRPFRREPDAPREPEKKPSMFEKWNMVFTIASCCGAVIAACLIPWGVWSIKTTLTLERSISDGLYINRTNYISDLQDTHREIEGVKDHVNTVDNQVAGIKGQLHMKTNPHQ